MRRDKQQLRRDKFVNALELDRVADHVQIVDERREILEDLVLAGHRLPLVLAVTEDPRENLIKAHTQKGMHILHFSVENYRQKRMVEWRSPEDPRENFSKVHARESGKLSAFLFKKRGKLSAFLLDITETKG